MTNMYNYYDQTDGLIKFAQMPNAHSSVITSLH